MKNDQTKAKKDLEELRKKIGMSIAPQKKKPTVSEQVKKMMSNTQTGEQKAQGMG